MGRIRTIKPEFWRHPVMARLPDDFQLLALSLLSMADDHGYFRADAQLVRGDVMPFREDLARISRGLIELARVGWIQLARHPETGLIGRIAKWETHQRVDRPGKSKLLIYWEESTREDVASLSRESRESLDAGTGNREQGTGKKELSLVPSEQAHPSASPKGSVDNSESRIRKPAYPPDVDHDAVIAAFHELLPELPKVVSWTEKRRTMLRMRWRELAEKDRKQGRPWPDSAAGVARFRAFFTFVRDSKFLMGKSPPRDGRVFCATLEWLLNPSNFLKVIEGNYHAEG